MNWAPLIRDETACDDTAMDSTEDIGGLLSTVLEELVNNEEVMFPAIPIIPRPVFGPVFEPVFELGTELGGRGVGTFSGGGGPTTGVTGLLVGTELRIGKELGVAIVGAVDIEREATEETSFGMSVEWFVSKEKLIIITISYILLEGSVQERNKLLWSNTDFSLPSCKEIQLKHFWEFHGKTKKCADSFLQ